jgi:hypothetical protein
MSFFTEGKIDLWEGKYHETIELVVKEGETLSIPPYWLYSFRYEDETFVTCSYFNSYMTEIATFQHTLLYWITKFTRPARAVPISKKEQPTEHVNEEATKPAQVTEITEDTDENQDKPLINPTNNEQTEKITSQNITTSDVSVPEPDIELTATATATANTNVQ